MSRTVHGIYGWMDINGNGIVDEGDYFGRTSSKVTSSGGVLTGIELRVSLMSDPGQ